MKALLFLTFLAFSLTVFGQTEEEKSTLVQVGQQAPDFTFTTSTGIQQSISSLKGKVIMVNFFATWCGPCMKELPHVQTEIFDKLKSNSNFQLLVIGREHSPEEMAKFKTDKAFGFDILADPKREIYSKFASQFIPRNFLIDREGKIIYSSVGFNEAEFASLIQLINEQLN